MAVNRPLVTSMRAHYALGRREGARDHETCSLPHAVALWPLPPGERADRPRGGPVRSSTCCSGRRAGSRPCVRPYPEINGPHAQRAAAGARAGRNRRADGDSRGARPGRVCTLTKKGRALGAGCRRNLGVGGQVARVGVACRAAPRDGPHAPIADAVLGQRADPAARSLFRASAPPVFSGFSFSDSLVRFHRPCRDRCRPSAPASPRLSCTFHESG